MRKHRRVVGALFQHHEDVHAPLLERFTLSTGYLHPSSSTRVLRDFATRRRPPEWRPHWHWPPVRTAQIHSFEHVCQRGVPLFVTVRVELSCVPGEAGCRVRTTLSSKPHARYESHREQERDDDALRHTERRSRLHADN